MGIDRFKIPEVLFDPPSNLGGSMLGISSLVTTSIGACDVDVRPMLYSNVMVTGGNSCIEVKMVISQYYNFHNYNINSVNHKTM